MKIRKKIKKTSLINFNLLKCQIYEKKNKNLISFGIEPLNFEIKQVLKIISLYNIKNKKILFVGFSYNKMLTNQLKQTFISKTECFNNFIKTYDYDLIVFNKSKTKDEIIFKKFNSLNIPLIVFGNYKNQTYVVNGNFRSKKVKNFCSFLIFSLLKKNLFQNYVYYKKI